MRARCHARTEVLLHDFGRSKALMLQRLRARAYIRPLRKNSRLAACKTLASIFEALDDAAAMIQAQIYRSGAWRMQGPSAYWLCWSVGCRTRRRGPRDQRNAATAYRYAVVAATNKTN